MPRGKWRLKDGINGRVFFPLTAARIQRWIKEGRVHEDDKVWHPGLPSWKKAGEVEKFKHQFEEQESAPPSRRKRSKGADSP